MASKFPASMYFLINTVVLDNDLFSPGSHLKHLPCECGVYSMAQASLFPLHRVLQAVCAVLWLSSARSTLNIFSCFTIRNTNITVTHYNMKVILS